MVFSEVLNDKLLDILKRDESDGGMGITKATRVQSLVIPTLANSNASNILMKSETGCDSFKLINNYIKQFSLF